MKHDLTPFFSGLAHKLNPKLGQLYDSAPLFWNDGIVGFIIGVPLTFIIYYPIAPSIFFEFWGINLSWLVQGVWYVFSAFVSFCVQHLFRKNWVFRNAGAKVEERKT